MTDGLKTDQRANQGFIDIQFNTNNFTILENILQCSRLSYFHKTKKNIMYTDDQAAITIVKNSLIYQIKITKNCEG